MESNIIVPDHLKNWDANRIIHDKYYVDNDLDVALWFRTNENKLMSVAAFSELMVITGPEKSRKTLLQQCMIMSNYIDDKSKTLSFEMDLKGAPVLYFDTEQPVRRSKKNNRRFHEICGFETQRQDFIYLNIVGMSSYQRMEFITHVITEVMDSTGKPPGFVVIDQIADLCPAGDINDRAGTSKVYETINAWRAMTMGRTLFSVIIHTNRGRQKTSGIMGSLLDKKADTMFLVDVDSTNVSIVTNIITRDKKIPKLMFRQDYDGTPRLINIEDMEHII